MVHGALSDRGRGTRCRAEVWRTDRLDEKFEVDGVKMDARAIPRRP